MKDECEGYEAFRFPPNKIYQISSTRLESFVFVPSPSVHAKACRKGRSLYDSWWCRARRFVYRDHPFAPAEILTGYFRGQSSASHWIGSSQVVDISSLSKSWAYWYQWDTCTNAAQLYIRQTSGIHGRTHYCNIPMWTCVESEHGKDFDFHFMFVSLIY